MEHMQSTLLEDLQRGFRLGFSDGGYRNYVNQYTTNDFAKSPYARAKDRDKKKYMCSRFSLCDEGEFLVNKLAFFGKSSLFFLLLYMKHDF